MTNSKFWALCGIVLLTALLLRLGAIVAMRPWSQQYERLYLFADARTYHNLAITFREEGITEHFRNKTIVYAPGYPIMLGIVYKLCGVSLTAGLLTNAIISVLTCGIIMLAVRRAFNEKVALASGLLFALHPHSVRFVCMLYSETLFMLLCSAFILILQYIPSQDKRWTLWLVMGGLVATLGTFVRISMLYFSVISILVWLLMRKTNKIYFIKNFVLFLLAYFIFLCPWMIHNKIHYGTFRLSASGEYNLLAITVAGAKTDDIDEFHRIRQELLQTASHRAGKSGARNNFERSKYFLEVAFEEISKEPAQFTLSIFKGFYHFWFRVSQAESSRLAELRESDPKTFYYVVYSYLFQTFLLLTWVASLLAIEKVPISWKVLSAVAFIYFASTVGNAAYSRFFLQALPYIVPVAAASTVVLYEWSRRLITERLHRCS
jgi:4-amino-4-deoxy-L-arabinose transferase-like glycosyltransferase